MPRLYLDVDLNEGETVALDEGQARYLADVLRLRAGALVDVFNGRDGQHQAQIAEIGKRGGALLIAGRTRAQSYPPDLRLLFSPLKRQATDWLVEKATELGVRELQPVMMRRTVAETVRTDRLAAIAREAAEQTERLDAPGVREPLTLARALDGWDLARPLIYADEQGQAPPILEALATAPAGKLALLIGPEGGFDPSERRMLRALAFVAPASLGPRILRAETAAVAALAVIQAAWGDWADRREAGADEGR
jgi:16S rRNA (uracil1498-N3)-methyltransferase